MACLPAAQADLLQGCMTCCVGRPAWLKIPGSGHQLSMTALVKSTKVMPHLPTATGIYFSGVSCAVCAGLPD